VKSNFWCRYTERYIDCILLRQPNIDYNIKFRLSDLFEEYYTVTPCDPISFNLRKRKQINYCYPNKKVNTINE
jgi:hypothetical protein